MGTTDPQLIEVPNLKLAKVGKDREKKRGGAAWAGARGAGAGFSGAAGGAGAGGFMNSGMSLAKLLMILLVSGGVSAGAWQAGNMLASNAPIGGPAAPKAFDSKDNQQYSDLSGVIKGQNSIPNSLGYVNNDGLTDAQRAAKKAAADAAAAKAAEDARAQAEADAKRRSAEDAQAAAATPESAPAAGSPALAKKSLTAGKFGGMNSSFGGGGGLSGGAGLSGGINRNFGSAVLPSKGQAGTLSGSRASAKVASTRVSAAPHVKSNSKGFAKQQLDNANGMSRTALATGKTESASAGAGTPFDNNAGQGSVISGPGVGSGVQTGTAGNGGATNPNTGGPTGTTACPDANYAPDANGNCVNQTSTPAAANAAPYQGLINMAMILLGIVMLLSLAAMFVPPGFKKPLEIMIGVLGVVVAGIGAKIATMPGGDFKIGAIIGVVGGFIMAAGAAGAFITSMPAMLAPAAALIAGAVGELAAASTKSASMM